MQFPLGSFFGIHVRSHDTPRSPWGPSAPIVKELSLLKLNLIFFNIGLFKVIIVWLPRYLTYQPLLLTCTTRIQVKSDLLYGPLCLSNRRHMTQVYTGSQMWNSFYSKFNVHCAISEYKKHFKTLQTVRNHCKQLYNEYVYVCIYDILLLWGYNTVKVCI